MLREADNADKEPALQALQAEPCKTAELCQLQTTCVHGYREHVAAYAELQRAKQATPGENAPNLAAITARLTAAQRDIQNCTEAEAATRRAYDL